MDIVIPSLTDPTVAPPGKHVMSIFVQYAPYNLKEGAADWPNQREAFGDAVIDTLAEYMPNLKSRILHRQVLTPWDLEQIYGLTEGNIFHGELSLEQLAFLRPLAGWSRYRTPVDKLWMCASGTHPGGGIMGAPGRALRADHARQEGGVSGYDAIVVGAGPNGLAAAVRLAQGGAAGGGAGARRRRRAGSRRGTSSTPATPSPASSTTRRWCRGRWRSGWGSPRTGSPSARRRRCTSPRRAAPDSCCRRTPPAPPRRSAGARAKDGDSYARYRAFLDRIAKLVGPVLAEPPPPLSPRSAGDWWQLGRRGLAVWRVSRRDLVELARVAPMCVADFLNERFATPLLVEALAAPAVASTWSGPWSAGTTTNLLLREAAGGGAIAGGPPALIAALARRGQGRRGRDPRRRRGGAHPPRPRAGRRRHARLRRDDRRAGGGLLRRPQADDARPPAAGGAAAQGRRGVPAAALPGHRGQGPPRPLRSAGAGRRRRPARRGDPHRRRPRRRPRARLRRHQVPAVSRRGPNLEIRVPTVVDPSLAPAGHHVVSILASYAPYDLEGGWTAEARERLGDAVVAVLERHAPGVGRRLVAREVLTPADLESRFALTGGQLHHGELALDQLLVMRPAPSAARYATPVPGLFLGGSGSHPGGGVRPTAGLLAAEAVLAS